MRVLARWEHLILRWVPLLSASVAIGRNGVTVGGVFCGDEARIRRSEGRLKHSVVWRWGEEQEAEVVQTSVVLPNGDRRPIQVPRRYFDGWEWFPSLISVPVVAPHLRGSVVFYDGWPDEESAEEDPEEAWRQDRYDAAAFRLFMGEEMLGGLGDGDVFGDEDDYVNDAEGFDY